MHSRLKTRQWACYRVARLLCCPFGYAIIVCVAFGTMSASATAIQSQVQAAVEDARERLFDRRDADTAAHAGTGAPIGYAPDSASPYGAPANSPTRSR
jgi:hypothetical protein